MRVYLTLILVLALFANAFNCQDIFQIAGGPSNKCGNDATQHNVRLNDCTGTCDSHFKIVSRNDPARGGFVLTEYDSSDCNSKVKDSNEFVCPLTYNSTGAKYASVGNYRVFCFADTVTSVQPTETPAGNSASSLAISSAAVVASIVAIVAAL